MTSPGIDRPLVRPEDYTRFVGEEARLETDLPFGGRRRFTGVIRGLEGDEVRLESGGETLRIPFPAIRKAKLVLTEARLKSHAAPARPNGFVR